MKHSTQRRLDERERRSNEIVDAAEALACELGWDNMTVDGVARRARLSRALVYLYFKDKTELHAALMERAKADLHRRFLAAVGECEGACRFEAMGRAYIRFANEMPHYFEALSRFETRPAVDPGGPSPTDTPRNEVHELMVEVLRQGQAQGVVRADCGDLGLTAVALWSFTHGLIQISTARRNQLDAQGIEHEALLEQAFRMLRRAISPENPEERPDA